jgi:hypothetical protein
MSESRPTAQAYPKGHVYTCTIPLPPVNPENWAPPRIRWQAGELRAVATFCRRTWRGNSTRRAELLRRKALAGNVLGRPSWANRGVFSRRNRPQNIRQAQSAPRTGLLVGETQRDMRSA